tara:strand:+ start:68 stop:448 length:381 start_codon:yes stop_codon:yes gene_type:complete
MSKNIRIDKFLWMVRLYKTRAISNKACTSGRVKVNNSVCKPSFHVNVDDELIIRKGIVKYQIIIKDFPKSRVSAKLVEQYIKDITPESEIMKLKSASSQIVLRREKGSGRPTKKERRELNKFLNKE